MISKRHLTGFVLVLACLGAISCGKSETADPQIKFVLKLDPNQERLNNLGQLVSIPSGNAGQNPDFNSFGIHYLELLQTPLTQIGKGEVLYHAPEINGAIDFSKAVQSANGGTLLTLPKGSLKPGTYTYLRASASYQNYNIKFNIKGLPNYTSGGTYNLDNQTATLASFVGFRQYIERFKVKDSTLQVNGARVQGFWGFEWSTTSLPYPAPYNKYGVVRQGQSAQTTVPNPLGASNPIPAGSCVLTGQLDKPLVVTGNETSDIVITLSFSVNKSFEWVDANGNGQLDMFANTNTIEQVVDMGLRGLKISHNR